MLLKNRLELFLLIFWKLGVEAFVKFSDPEGKIIFQGETVSFFQHRAPFFNVSGLAVELVPERVDRISLRCTFSKNVSLPRNLTRGAKMHTVIYLSYLDSECPFNCISETFKLVQKFGKYLSSLNYPNPDTFLVFRDMDKHFGVGTPVMDYTGKGFFDYDGPPPDGLKFQLLDSEHINEMLDDLREHKNYTLNVVQENGKWNELFLSFKYNLVNIIITIVNVITLLYAAYKLHIAINDDVLTLDFRNVIFALSVISAILNITLPALRIYSFARKIMETCSAWFTSLAFHLLLYFWSVFLMRLYQNRFIYFFRILVVYSAVVSSLIFAWNVYYYMTPPMNINNNFAGMLTIPIAISQYLTAIVFILFGAHFYFRVRHMRQMSKESIRALKRLSWLALVAFACYVPLACSNLPYFREKIHIPIYNLIIQTIFMCGLSMRANALMLILGIKIAPSKLRELTPLEAFIQRIAGIFRPTTTGKAKEATQEKKELSGNI